MVHRAAFVGAISLWEVPHKDMAQAYVVRSERT